MDSFRLHPALSETLVIGGMEKAKSLGHQPLTWNQGGFSEDCGQARLREILGM